MKIVKDEEISLSKFLAISGIASRRKVVDIIKSGTVLVNDTVVTEPGFKITVQDVVKIDGKKIERQKKIYILLNKPKNCITTVSDEKGRATVMDLVKDAIYERVYPIGRLDRNTTGVYEAAVCICARLRVCAGCLGTGPAQYVRAIAECGSRTGQLADVLRRLQELALQQSGSDQHRQR